MSVYMCLCFFFKQKTAYEMRISDWSSDVCSSDLAAQATYRQGKLGRLFRGRYGRDHRSAEARRTAADGGAGVHAPAGRRAGDSGKGVEIGRASCRERVCQYV